MGFEAIPIILPLLLLIYLALAAISRSNMSREQCISQLDEMLDKMKGENMDTQTIATLIPKIEADGNVD